jgi:CYTH domain-containing protein
VFAKDHLRFTQISKDRFATESGYEVDCMNSPGAGEIVAEYEYSPEEPVDSDSLLADLVVYLGGTWRDITDDSRYSNAAIAENGFPNRND